MFFIWLGRLTGYLGILAGGGYAALGFWLAPMGPSSREAQQYLLGTPNEAIVQGIFLLVVSLVIGLLAVIAARLDYGALHA